MKPSSVNNLLEEKSKTAPPTNLSAMDWARINNLKTQKNVEILKDEKKILNSSNNHVQNIQKNSSHSIAENSKENSSTTR